MKNILGLGHPRTGTRYTSKICKHWGLNVGHEKIEESGVIAWQLVLPNGPYPFTNIKNRPSYRYLIYNVRNPKESLPSIVYTEDTNIQSVNFRKRFCNFNHNKIENAIESICTFDKLISNLNPDLFFRIEDEDLKLFNFLKDKFDINYTIYKKKENARKHKSFNEMLAENEQCSKYYIDKINNYCLKYGYDEIKF